MDHHKLLSRAMSARLLLEQPEIQEAFDSFEEDMKEQVFMLQEDNPEILRLHRSVKALIHVKQRLESYASSEQTHRNYVEQEARKAG